MTPYSSLFPCTNIRADLKRWTRLNLIGSLVFVALAQFSLNMQATGLYFQIGNTNCMPWITSLTTNAGTNLQLSLTTRAEDTNATIFASTNLSTWTRLAVVDATAGAATFTDSTWTSFQYRFYGAAEGIVTNGSPTGNVVGFISVPLVSGNTFVANQLDSGSNTLAQLIPQPPNGTIVNKWNEATQSYTNSTYRFGSWTVPSMMLAPGEGANISAPSPFTNTFFGQVLQGTLVNTFPTNYSIRSCMLPLQGKISTELGLIPHTWDNLSQWDPASQAYVTYTYSMDGTWSPNEPTIQVGESFFYNAGTSNTWTNFFQLCSP